MKNILCVSQRTFAGILPGIMYAKRIIRDAVEVDVTVVAVKKAISSILSSNNYPQNIPIIVLGGHGFVGRINYLLENIGHWYGKPAAKNVLLYANFESTFEPAEIRFGSTLENLNTTVRSGKKGCKYLKADGIHLTYQEPGEEIACTVKMPDKKGSYMSWLAVFSDEGDCGVHYFKIKVKKK